MKPYYDEDAITLYRGDSHQIMPLLPAQSVDLIITDPPYFQPATANFLRAILLSRFSIWGRPHE